MYIYRYTTYKGGGFNPSSFYFEKNLKKLSKMFDIVLKIIIIDGVKRKKEHKMKKVFRTRKFIEKCIEFGQIEHIVDNMLSDGNWCQKLEGKTLQEIHKMGYECNENWLVEE